MLRKRHSEHTSLSSITTSTSVVISSMSSNGNVGGGGAKYHASSGGNGGNGVLMRSRSSLSSSSSSSLSSSTTSSSMSMSMSSMGLSNFRRSHHSTGNFIPSMSSSTHLPSSMSVVRQGTIEDGRMMTHQHYIHRAVVTAFMTATSMLLDAPLVKRTSTRMKILTRRIYRYNEVALKRYPTYERACRYVMPRMRSRCVFARIVLGDMLRLLRLIATELHSAIRSTTCAHRTAVVFVIFACVSIRIYYVDMPSWKYEEEWKRWESTVRESISGMLPPSLPPDGRTRDWSYYVVDDRDRRWTAFSPRSPRGDGGVLDRGDNASEYAVPIPDYAEMGRTREVLASRLRDAAVRSCDEQRRRPRRKYDREDGLDRVGGRSLPVIGITVANDTPENRYLRRLLYTIDANIVGSIVITWYDEMTESQLMRDDGTSLSHDVIGGALGEFISRRGYVEVKWDAEEVGTMTSSSGGGGGDDVFVAAGKGGVEITRVVRLADAKSMKLMSRMAQVRQFCITNDESSRGGIDPRADRYAPTNDVGDACVNELVILRFPTNLGFSSGVNNALMIHPRAPHWLIANYDIAYPPDVLGVMGIELERAREEWRDLAVHTFGYIYGRGKIENPWSNFVMTSCAVAHVGVWDENIFPAYYEDDDYRDRIRYVLGEWIDVIGDSDRYNDAPLQFMNDSHLIRYMTDRNVSVAHGPLDAETYLSGTHETMKKVHDEEEAIEREESRFLVRLRSSIEKLRAGKGRPDDRPGNPLHYESLRWSTVKEVSDAGGYFRCKHGALPDAGEHGEDPLRYFGWHERFLVPFVNRTRVARLREYTSRPNETVVVDTRIEKRDRRRRTRNDGAVTAEGAPSPWAAWTFNATRRHCVHEAVNVLLSIPSAEARTKLTRRFRDSCSVC